MGQQFRQRFNEKKATQLAVAILHKAGGVWPHYSLVKLIYFIDRAALDCRGFAVSTDTYECRENGPVVREILNLSKEESGRDEGIWSQYIQAIDKDSVELIAGNEIGEDELSEYELNLIDEIFIEHGKKEWDQFREESHALPEYREPTVDDRGELKSFLPIDDILRAMGKSTGEIEFVRHVYDGQALLDSLK